MIADLVARLPRGVAEAVVVVLFVVAIGLWASAFQTDFPDKHDHSD